jgi:acyl-CoA synthetase (AMP-forming)/AMP-acid ligase II
MAIELPRTEVEVRLTAPGALYEIVDEDVRGERMPVFANRARSLRELLDESLAHGDDEYVVFGERRMSYAAHHARAATLARVLRDECGVAPGDRVAILSANCPDWMTTFWAATSIGAIAASMNSMWADPELEHTLAKCEPAVVVADRERLAAIERVCPRAPFRVIDIDAELDALVAGAGERELPDVRIDEDDPAAIIYTSGTTGRSKGAVASHRSVCGFVHINRFGAALALAALGIEDPAVVASVTRQTALVTVPLFHASGVYGFVVNQLGSGGKVVLRPGRFDEEDVLRLIEAERVTIWSALGSMGPRVAERAKTTTYDLSSLRTLAVGGAPVSPTVQTQLRESFPNAGLSVSMGYTSSEAVAVVTRIQGDDLRDHPTSAGSVVATTDLEIRDGDGRPVPDGIDGEIHVRSPYLMTGYWRDPEATAAVFKPGRWLAMGDIGRMEDGRLYINSRARDMMLVNAENVYPTEVEYRLDAHPDVVESAVFGVDDDRTGQAIRAVVVRRPASMLTEAALAAWCREGLAGFKVPTQWEIRSEPLPRNASGKILKRELEPGAG